MATNTLHNALCITLNLFNNLRLRIAIVRSAWRQRNISKHTSTVSCDLVLKIFLNVLFTTLMDLYWYLRKEQASSPYNRTGKHLVFTSCTITSFEAIRPTLRHITNINRPSTYTPSIRLQHARQRDSGVNVVLRCYWSATGVEFRRLCLNKCRERSL